MALSIRHKGQTPYGTPLGMIFPDTTRNHLLRTVPVNRPVFKWKSKRYNPFAPATNKVLHRLALALLFLQRNKACHHEGQTMHTQSRLTPDSEYLCRVRRLALILLKTVALFNSRYGQHALQSGSLRCFQHILLLSYRPLFHARQCE